MIFPSCLRSFRKLLDFQRSLRSSQFDAPNSVASFRLKFVIVIVMLN